MDQSESTSQIWESSPGFDKLLYCARLNYRVYIQAVCLFVYMSVCVAVCVAVCSSVYICLLLLVFEIFFLLLYQDPQYVSVGNNGEASTPQELKQVGIVPFWRCLTFFVSGIVWTISLKLTFLIYFEELRGLWTARQYLCYLFFYKKHLKDKILVFLSSCKQVSLATYMLCLFYSNLYNRNMPIAEVITRYH